VLLDHVYRQAETQGEHPAVVFGDQTLTYAELVDRIERLAHGLAAHGLAAGDAAALLMPNSADFVTSFLAVTALGAVAVPINPGFKQDEIDFHFRDCSVRAVVADPQGAAAAEQIIGAYDGAITLVSTGDANGAALAFDALIDGHGRRRLAPRAADEDFVFLYSSGSTGRPKRVARTHALCLAESLNYIRTINISSADTVFCAVPLFHSYGMGICGLAPLLSGATLVILEDPHPFVLQRGRALELLERHRATLLPGVPFIFRLLAEAPGDVDLSSIRMCFSAGTALPPSVFHAFRDRHGLSVRQLYGSTETGVMSVNLDPDPAPTLDSVGKPVEGVQFAILDDDGEALAPGSDGDIAVRSPALVRGYAAADAADHEAFRDGWFRPGDVGHLDEAGRLYITGRRKLFIDVAGNKVDPVEVEEVLGAHPAVREAVVLGVKGPVAGEEIVKAAVVAGDDCDERELIAFCRRRLANFKVPQVIEFRDEIPRSPVGKVLRKYLL
jgi:long-chain acyl-CoA synthetase